MVEPVRIELTSKILPYPTSTSLVRTNYSLIKKSLTILFINIVYKYSSIILNKTIDISYIYMNPNQTYKQIRLKCFIAKLGKC